MFDFIDLLIDSSDEVLTGHYYKRRPKSIRDGKVTFNYKQLDPSSRVFDSVLMNVRADSETYAIKTNDNCGFNVGGYICTQNGKNWVITEVVTNEQEEGAGEVLRWFKTAKQSESSVRLLRVDNLWTEETYSECVVTINFRDNTGGIFSAVLFNAEIKVYDNIEPTVTTIEAADKNAKEFPYIITRNKVTFFVPQGTQVDVKLGIGYDWAGNYQTVKISKNQTCTDKLVLDVEYIPQEEQ